jgi:hypothetical protein
MTFEEFSAAIEALRPEIERQYPLTLGTIIHEPLEGDHGWSVEYRIEAHRHGPMSLLDLAGLDDWIRSKTGVGVIVDTSQGREGAIGRRSTATAECAKIAP